MIPSLTVGPKLIAAAAVLLIGFAVGWGSRGHFAKVEVATLKAQAAAIRANAADAARVETERALTDSRKAIAESAQIAKDAQNEATRLAAAAAAADRERDGLRNAAKRYQASRCPAPSTPHANGGSKTAATTAGMQDGDRLLRVFGECDAAQGSLAAALGRANSAGLACERSFESLRSICAGD